ncbi:threonine synthase [bacterium]|jgi:threonine synthase|nr:threonine synthase [bacterium]MBT3849843.1 threonine synthase [bacterium]MBT4434968.1 threonine synthase [bacterium]MDG2445643.1 threonine synthase [Thermodesulfobacteriota bacterium]
MDKYNCWFQSIENSDYKYDINEVIYRCSKTGSLLEVEHDLNELKKKTPDYWKDLFDSRYRRQSWPYGSGVWGKKEWVAPFIEDKNIVSMYEGGTNLFWADKYGKQVGVEDLWIKMCGNSHTGSFKDLGMTVLVSAVKQLIANGNEIKAVACASTGDTSAALSAYCAAAGLKSIVFLPKNKVSVAQLVQPLANGASVVSLDTDFDGCMKIVQEVCKKQNIYLANSINSLRIEGQKTISIELCQQFDWEVPDWIIIPGGNLGNVSALGKGFLMLKDLGIISKLPRLVCAQAENANPLYLSYLKDFETFNSVSAKTTLANAIQIGDPVSVNKAINILKKFDGIVEQANEDELATSSAKVDLTGTFNCPHTGVAVAAFEKLVKKKIIKKNDKVVIISTAHGLKFVDFKIHYHLEQLKGISNQFSNHPFEMEAKVDKVLEVLEKQIL